MKILLKNTCNCLTRAFSATAGAISSIRVSITVQAASSGRCSLPKRNFVANKILI